MRCHIQERRDRKMQHIVTAHIEFDPETNLYVGTVPGLPGAHTEGATLDELQVNLREVVELIFEEAASRGEDLGLQPFIGTHQIVVDV
jgi:predicted RNase H-like HicB family nuclease